MRWVLGLAISVLLTACQTDDANIYGSLNGQRIVGNEAYVTITNVWNEMDALPLAQKHCGQFGKVAKYTRREGSNSIFDCVKA
jgi:putative hemolysin